jgi:ATP-binding cassette, subfamily B, bacterial
MDRLREKFIEESLKQPGCLPAWIKESVQGEGQTIMSYMLVDMTQGLDLSFDHWLVLSRKRLYFFAKNDVLKINLNSIGEIKDHKGTSIAQVAFLNKDSLEPLLTICFSKRQEANFEYLRFILNELMEGKIPEFKDSDEQYEMRLLKPFLEVQDSLTTDKRGVLVRLLAYLLPYKKFWIVGGLSAIGATLLALVPAYLSGLLVDEVIGPYQQGDMTYVESSHQALILIGVLAGAYILREFFIWIRLNRMSILGEWVARDLRRDLYSHMQKLDLDYFSKRQTGSLISRVSSDTDRIWDFIAFGIVEVSIAILSLIFLSVTLISLDLELGLIMTLPVPLLLYSIYRHGEGIKKLFLKAWRKWSNVTNILSDTIPGIQVVKAFGQEDREITRFNDRNEAVTEEFTAIHDRWTAFWPKLMLGIQIILLSVWIMARQRLLADPSSSDFLSVGAFVSFLLYMTMFAAPIEIIGQMARMLNRALSSAYRIFEVLDSQPMQKNADHPVILKEMRGEVVFEKVSFSYDGLRPILKDVSFHVKPGEMIGLVGPSGGGKSTITKLLMRFYDVTGGKILVDGEELNMLDIQAFRRQVGMVLQDPYLFHGTILENIGYGLSVVNRSKVVEAARVANAHDFILKLPHGYDTIVGERGHTLSGGERQRISIARAVLHDPKILILDEATSAVDTETERKIQEALDRLVKGRTVFAIAHRLSTLRDADRLFVIKDGRVIEQGTHDELIQVEKGLYAKLLRLQHESAQEMAL